MATRRFWLMGLLFLASAWPALAAPSSNPVDLYGPDGLSFTEDDPLIVRGGYTNSAVFATACGRRKAGAGTTNEFLVRLGLWNPTNKIVATHLLDVPGVTWQREFEIPDPDDPVSGGLPFYTFDGASQETPDPTTLTCWNNGNNLRTSFLHVHNWDWDGNVNFGPNPPPPPAVTNCRTCNVALTAGQGVTNGVSHGLCPTCYQTAVDDGTLTSGVTGGGGTSIPAGVGTGDDPAVTVCARHIAGMEDLVKDIRCERCRTDIGILSITNLENGKSGITARGFCVVEGVQIHIDGEIDVDVGPFTISPDIKGYVHNGNPRINWEWGPFSGTYTIDADAAIKIIDKVRDKVDETADPDLGNLDSAGRSRVSQAESDGKLVDCIANECLRAVLQAGQWLPWLETDDMLSFRGNSAIDLSGTDLAGTPQVAAGTVDDTDKTNNAMSFVNSEALLYGRDPGKTPPHARLIEWFAANWLCVNVSIADPYGGANGTMEAPAKANWLYHDVITEKELTKKDDPYQVDWPFGNRWYGGQGMILACQGAAGHNGDSDGTEYNVTSPGNPGQVFAGLVAFTPNATASGGTPCGVYNLSGVALGTGPVYRLDPDEDPAATRKVPWGSAISAFDTPGDVRFFYANVANGWDDRRAKGTFEVNWDFGCDGTPDTKLGNVSFNVAGKQAGLLWIRDEETGRTGAHRIVIGP